MTITLKILAKNQQKLSQGVQHLQKNSMFSSDVVFKTKKKGNSKITKIGLQRIELHSLCIYKDKEMK